MAFIGLLLAFVVALFFLWVSQTLQRSSVGKTYGRHGVSHLLAGDDGGAIANFTESILTKPSAAAYAGRGLAFIERGDDDGAIADFTESIRITPNFTAHNGRGHAYFYKEDYKKAIADLTVAIQLNPNCAEAYYTRGIIYARMRDQKSFADLIACNRLGLRDPEMREHAKRCLAAYEAKQANQRMD